jgi:hypothetical protein
MYLNRRRVYLNWHLEPRNIAYYISHRGERHGHIYARAFVKCYKCTSNTNLYHHKLRTVRSATDEQIYNTCSHGNVTTVELTYSNFVSVFRVDLGFCTQRPANVVFYNNRNFRADICVGVRFQEIPVGETQKHNQYLIETIASA